MGPTTNSGRYSRRSFLKGAAAMAAAPYIVPASALGLDGAVAPSNRITMACIGVNSRGTGDMKSFLNHADTQVVAVCDVDKAHRERAKRIVETRYAKNRSGYTGCDVYNDFRDVMARDDVDAVMIATPDHWHALIAIAAAKAGKDIYCEKPISKTVAEGRALCDAVRCYGRIFQTGSQLRSVRNVRFACELVRNGRIGKLHTIRTYLPPSPSCGPQPEMSVPQGFDYDLWLGPARWAPYTVRRCHRSFRYVSDYAGGTMTDLGAHDNDLAQWGNGTEHTGPVEIEGRGEFPRDGLFDAAMRYEVRYTYANGVTLICSTDPYPEGTGVRFEGTEGWVYTRWAINAEPQSLLETNIGPNEIHLYKSEDHHRNFLDCVKSRKETIVPAETGHRSITICHLGNIAMKLGRKLRWDPDRERFKDDPEADRYLLSPMRAPWRLEV
ncbi:MAG: Gfo/Idh/MocA family oxidoreductase [Nitrospiraceae bacterium]|nr:Gfo/Idh/MocA family oxidoreductase [Nitrospiraceae bacterium]